MYLLDTNALIEASRHYYAFDLASKFWTWLLGEHHKGTIGSVDMVRGEILPPGKDSGDELSRWAADMPEGFWRSCEDAQQSLVALAKWAESGPSQFTSGAIDAFFGAADFALVAYAHANDCTVVTRGVANPHSKRRILIPDACAELGVRCVQPFKVYRRLGLCFSD